MANEILQAYERAIKAPDTVYTQPIVSNPFEKPGTRPNSVYVGGTWMGDEGKGVVIADFNRELVEKLGAVVSLRTNGGANAGHHMFIGGREFLCNQLPTAVAQEHATGIITRGMVLHPADLVMEIARTEQTFGGRMPGRLIIDDRTPLCLDTHRALDINEGSTGRGIGPAYGDVTLRRALTVRDLMSSEWERTFGKHYAKNRAIIEADPDIRALMEKNGYNNVEDFQIVRLDNSRVRLGTQDDFLANLAQTRYVLAHFARERMSHYLEGVLANENIGLSFEEAQASGLDLRQGISPDTTSSRVSPRFVCDATYGMLNGEDIALKVGVTKTVYASVVGSKDKLLPGKLSDEDAGYYQEEFGEKGKTTGRPRGIYHMPLPLMLGVRNFADYDMLIATHIDAARQDVPVKYMSEVYDRETGEPGKYSPYQDEINKLDARFVEFPGWDGGATQAAKKPEDLEPNVRRVLSFLGEVMDAPVLMARNGGSVGNHIKWY